jgi:hypothetical protein
MMHTIQDVWQYWQFTQQLMPETHLEMCVLAVRESTNVKYMQEEKSRSEMSYCSWLTETEQTLTSFVFFTVDHEGWK